MEANMLLDSYPKALRLPTFLHSYRDFAEEPTQASFGYDRFLLALVDQELGQRERNRIARRIKGAHFPVLKELAHFDFSCITSPNKQRVLQLAQGNHIHKAEPILMVENPGLRKTHIATGMALPACRQGHRVHFYNAVGPVSELILAQDEHCLPKPLAAPLRHQLVVLDEAGFIPFSPLGAQLMFQLCSALCERVAMIVTTNLRFADRTHGFGDERLTAALLGRLTHRAHILEFIGESYRLRQRMQQEAEQPHYR